MQGRVLQHHCVSAAPDKGLLVTGGVDQDDNVTDESFVLCLKTGEITMVTSMQHARAMHACASTDQGHVVAGGHSDEAVLDSVELLLSGSQSWQLLEPLPEKRYRLTAVHSYLDKLLIVGGQEENPLQREMEVLKYVAAENRWEQWEGFNTTRADLVTLTIDELHLLKND